MQYSDRSKWNASNDWNIVCVQKWNDEMKVKPSAGIDEAKVCSTK